MDEPMAFHDSFEGDANGALMVVHEDYGTESEVPSDHKDDEQKVGPPGLPLLVHP